MGLSVVLKYYVVEEQSGSSVTSLDILDPRLPTRVARPPVVKKEAVAGQKRNRKEQWGGMRFLCGLTKICTSTAEKMREHMQGELYKKMAADTPTWPGSPEQKVSHTPAGPNTPSRT